MTNTLLWSATLAFLLTWAIGRFFDRASPEARERMKKIGGPEARQLAKKGALFVDVVTPHEFSAQHIKGAINIPVQQLASRLAELGDGKEVVVYCRSGARSARAAKIVAESGRRVYDLGPMHAY